MTNVAYTITSTGILMFLNGEQHQIPQDHPNFGKIKDLLREKRYAEIVPLMDVRGTVKKWISSNVRFKLENDRITLDQHPFSEAITDKVLSMIDAGFNPDPLFNFLMKVRKNPSSTAQNELLLFCVANDFMIHEDGDILAYKSVRSDFTDIHSGKFSNHVGAVIEMERHAVDDDRDRTCSYGLHFASHQYATTWTSYGHLVLLKVNPRDVVSIPSDYNNQKGRTCRYEVIAEIKDSTKLPKKEVYTDCDCGIATAPSRGAAWAQKEVDRKGAIWAGWTQLQSSDWSVTRRNALLRIEDEILHLCDEFELDEPDWQSIEDGLGW